MKQQQRILTIDVMRGITLFLMLFVNDLYVAGVPAWLGHRPANYDGMGLADWVFPGFLFMVGMAVPFAIQNRLQKNQSHLKILYHIFIRTLSLLTIGVLMLNCGRVNSELTGIPGYLWAILIYICIFLIWNRYGNLKIYVQLVIKGMGIIGLLLLLAIFKGGTAENVVWIKTGWWGILGLIGWGYLVTSIVYLAFKQNIIATAIGLLGFILLNILSQLEMLGFLNPVIPVLGVVIEGNVPSIVMAGLLFSLLLRKFKHNYKRFILMGTALGIFAMLSGLVLRHWFIVSKIIGTPSWAMLCNGISMLVFVILFVIVDVFGKTNWTKLFQEAGQNSLTTYLAPDVFYYSIWLSGVPLLFYKHSGNHIIVIIGSIVWALLMIQISVILSKIGIRLKL